jgi:hypothetical protein
MSLRSSSEIEKGCLISHFREHTEGILMKGVLSLTHLDLPLLRCQRCRPHIAKLLNAVTRAELPGGLAGQA